MSAQSPVMDFLGCDNFLTGAETLLARHVFANAKATILIDCALQRYGSVSDSPMPELVDLLLDIRVALAVDNGSEIALTEES